MKKMLIIIVAVVLVLAIGGGVAAFLLLGEKEEKTFVYDVPGEAIVTNMKGSNGFVKASVSLGLTTDKKNADLDKETARIRDAIVFCLRTKSKDDLTGADVKQGLSDEICEELTKITGLDIFKEVYFSDLVVQ